MNNMIKTRLNQYLFNNTQNHKYVKALVYASVLSLAACGGGGGTTKTTPTTPTTPTGGGIPNETRAEVVLNLAFTPIKNFQFSWNETESVDHYVLTENSDGSSGFSVLGATLDATVQSFNHIVPLYQRTNAQYLLQTCYSSDDSDCVDSNTVSVSDALTSSIGYFKADRVESGKFGTSVALSADGHTLAIGAVGDNFGGTGINPAQSTATNLNTGAVYIFTLENETWQKQAYIKQPPYIVQDGLRNNSNFGSAISLSDDGNTLAVGANTFDVVESNGTFIRDVGAVTIYARTGSDWQQQAVLNFRDALHRFGSSLSLSGNGFRLAVSGFNKDIVYVFSKKNNLWDLQKEINSPYTSTSLASFGTSLAFNFAGNMLAIGAKGDDSSALGFNGNQNMGGASNSGAVFIYRSKSILLMSGVMTTWSRTQYIKASNAVLNFGAELDLNKSGNTLAVSTFKAPSVIDPSVMTGAVYLFSASGNVSSGSAATWTQQAIVNADNSEDMDDLNSLSLSDDGNTLVFGASAEQGQSVGINGDQNNDVSAAGATYVFNKNGTNWSQTSYIKASNTDASDSFGQAVAISGDGNTIAIGATGEGSNSTGIGGEQSDNNEAQSGAVYLY